MHNLEIISFMHSIPLPRFSSMRGVMGAESFEAYYMVGFRHNPMKVTYNKQISAIENSKVKR